ncbi:MAG: YihY/virulence factor BrkB family protein [Candidatus Dactylopiibacterium sp.]|nr:YihY/virulence factor BrkB family protein [Candidatus Dactylopiibacterium sp.]
MNLRARLQRLLEIPLIGLAYAAVVAWMDDKASSLGAALAFYTMFSLAPLLLIAVSLAGLVFGAEAARGEIVSQLNGLVGPSSAATIETMLASLDWPAGGVAGTLLGLGIMVVGATTVFAELQNALDRIWEAPPVAETGGLWRLARTRVLSFGLVLGLGFLLIVSLVFSAAMAALARWWTPVLREWQFLLGLLNIGVSFCLLLLMFAMIYKLMPRVRIAWADVWIGALVTATLFTLGRSLISLYLGHSAVASGFGAASSLVVLLVWVYYSAQIFLLGAEFTWVYAHRYGSLRARPGGPDHKPA